MPSCRRWHDPYFRGDLGDGNERGASDGEE
jgi:hypothetical protein